MNMVRFVLIEKAMPKEFWAETANFTYYVLHRSLTSAVKGQTPQERWSGIKPSVKHFRIFKCLAYIHIPDAKHTKLDDQSTVNILVRVSDESKGYKLYYPRTKKVVISKDIYCKERKWDWDSAYDKKIQTSLYQEDNLNEGEAHKEERDLFVLNSEDEEPATAGGPSSREGRQRHPLAWMKDYVTDNATSSEEVNEDNCSNNIRDMALVAFTGDLATLFEEALKDPQWKVAMSKEIEFI